MTRYLGRVLLAALFTGALFLFMRYLINPQNPPELVEEDSVDIRITREEREEQSRRNTRRLPPEPEKTPPPPPPANNQDVVSLNEGGGYAVDLPGLNPADGGRMPMDTDRRAMPIVRIPPQYPERPLRRGIEGWVLLEFTITAAGSVEDVRVLDADPPNQFERASIRALQRWKYQPKIVNGQPVAQPGMQDIIVFQIEN